MTGIATDLLSIDAAMAHLRVDDISEEGQIGSLIPAAVAALEDHLGRQLVGPAPSWPNAADVPANIVHALKLILTALYDDRQAGMVNWAAVDSLVGRYTLVGFA